MAVSTIDALYHSGSEKLTTSATGITVTGTVAATAVTGDGSGLTGLPAGVGGANGVTFNDNVKAQFGAGSDLQIYHDGSNSIIHDNGTGNLQIRAGNLNILNAAGTENYLSADNNGAVNLFYDNSKKLETTSTGVTVTQSGTGVGLLVTGGSYNYQAKFESTDAEANIVIEDSNSTNDYNRIGVAGNEMRFVVNNNQVFTILSSGAKDFGSFQAFSGGYNGIFGAGSAASYALRLDATGTGSAGVLQVVNGYGQVGSISVNGASTQFNTSSDYRLKTDVQPMTGASARVQALNPVNFEWIADGNRTDGFLAHEAQEVVPEAITGIKDAMKDEPYEVTPAVLDDDGNVTTEAVMGTRSVPDYQGIDQSKLVPLLTAALQEALTEIASLKTRVEALEA